MTKCFLNTLKLAALTEVYESIVVVLHVNLPNSTILELYMVNEKREIYLEVLTYRADSFCLLS